jgi:prepilin-type N-terminal cleavage/methylation domain-containing protein
MKQQKGFTLLEVLLVVAAIGILAGIVILAINPQKQLDQLRDSGRESDVRTILDAVYQYHIENDEYPSPIDTTLRMIGTASTGCNINCGGSGESASVIGDDEQSEFDLGAYSDTEYSAGAVTLSLPATLGIFESDIKNTSTLASWGTFSWIPSFPMYKELPDNGVSESAYPDGNANMSGNILLMHMNDGVSGAGQTIFDTSGNNDHGTTVGNPNCADSGMFNGACSFPGGTHYIDIDNINVNTSPGAHNTVEFWMYWTGGNSQMPFGWQQAYDLWFAGSCFGFNTGQGNVFGMSSAGLSGAWHHVAAVFYNGVPSASTVKLYIDGEEQSLSACQGTTSASRTVTANARISGWRVGNGYYFGGSIDELAVYNRELSEEEIIDHYKRGATRMEVAMRTCDDPACDTESYTTTYSELNDNSADLPSVSISDLDPNQYFQYRITLSTDDTTYIPSFIETEVSYTGAEGGEITAASCIDLSSYLAPEYITDIPFDGSIGSEEQTYYVIKETSNGRIYVRACNAEYEEEIAVTR